MDKTHSVVLGGVLNSNPTLVHPHSAASNQSMTISLTTRVGVLFARNCHEIWPRQYDVSGTLSPRRCH